ALAISERPEGGRLFLLLDGDRPITPAGAAYVVMRTEAAVSARYGRGGLIDAGGFERFASQVAYRLGRSGRHPDLVTPITRKAFCDLVLDSLRWWSEMIYPTPIGG
ncbi:MAG: hypothetical protein ACP5KN_04040, partial [Armatimonadota bacterium]